MTNRKPKSGTVAVLGVLIGPGIPGGYMAITGHAYTWARAWYATWLVVGLLVLVAKAARND